MKSEGTRVRESIELRGVSKPYSAVRVITLESTFMQKKTYGERRCANWVSEVRRRELKAKEGGTVVPLKKRPVMVGDRRRARFHWEEGKPSHLVVRPLYKFWGGLRWVGRSAGGKRRLLWGKKLLFVFEKRNPLFEYAKDIYVSSATEKTRHYALIKGKKGIDQRNPKKKGRDLLAAKESSWGLGRPRPLKKDFGKKPQGVLWGGRKKRGVLLVLFRKGDGRPKFEMVLGNLGL